MTKQLLNVPFVSRYGADGARLDCGACCVAMLFGAMTQPTSAQEIIAASGKSGRKLSPTALIRGAQALGLRLFRGKGWMLDGLQRLLDNGQPPIVSLKYSHITDRPKKKHAGRHYVVVVGYDTVEGLVYVNDPHYPEAGEAGSGGYQRAYPYAEFLAAWEAANFRMLAPVPPPPPEAPADGDFSFSTPKTTGEVWVIAPLGLRMRAQPEAAAASVADGVPFGSRLGIIGPESGPDAAGYFWQQVLTDQGVTGWVAAGKGGDRYLGDKPPVAPSTVYVLDTPPVRQAGGLGLRETRSVEATPTERAAVGDALTVYQRVTEADSATWLWVKSPGGGFGWAREKADGVLLISATAPTGGVKGEKPAFARKMERGVHGAPITTPINNLLPRLQALRIRWYKMLDDGNPANLELITALKQAGIEPIVRLFHHKQFPGRLAEHLRQRYGAVRAAGAAYVEIGNEPNLECEWREPNSWQNAAQVNSVADNWYLDAKEAIQAGLKPAIYAMAPTERNRGVNQHWSSVQWLVGMMRRLAATHGAEVKAWLANEQAWLAVHTADFGQPFDYDPFTGGIDDMCLRGYEVARKIVFDTLGVWPVTISTEGGVYSPKHLRDDLKWPSPYTDEQWGQRLEEMFDYPTQMRAMCPWTLSDEGVHDTNWHGCGWYDLHGNPRSPAMKLKVHKG